MDTALTSLPSGINTLKLNENWIVLLFEEKHVGDSKLQSFQWHSIWQGAKAGELWNSPECPVTDERPCRPCSRPALWMWSQPASGYNTLPLSLSPNEIKSTSSVIWTQGQAIGRRQTDWQHSFDFIVTTEDSDIHCVPVLSTIVGVRPFQHPARGGLQN